MQFRGKIFMTISSFDKILQACRLSLGSNVYEILPLCVICRDTAFWNIKFFLHFLLFWFTEVIITVILIKTELILVLIESSEVGLLFDMPLSVF
jgi:hypothetical protein